MALSSGVKVLGLAMVILLLVGCSTIASLVGMNHGPRIYSGVREDVRIIDRGGIYEHKMPFFVILAVLDFPLSFALDTLLLPLTIPWDLLESDSPIVEGKSPTQ